MSLLSLGGLAVEDTARPAAVTEESLSKLVTSVLKLEADALGVKILSPEQSWSVESRRGVGAVSVEGLEPGGLGGGGRRVLQWGLELTALVGAGALAPEVVPPGLRPPVAGGEPDADVGLLVLGDEDGAEGRLVLLGGEEAGAGAGPLGEGAVQVLLQEPEGSLLGLLLSCGCRH